MSIQHNAPGGAGIKYTKTHTGDGSSGDPWVPEQAVTLLQGGVEVTGANPLEVIDSATGAEVAAVAARIGATTDAEAASGNGSLIAIAKRLRTLLGGLGLANDAESATGDGTAVALLKRVRTLLGATDETAPANDIAASGLNGRLQRIAQNITTIIGRWPASLGQKARAASLAVTLSSEDMTAISAIAGTEASPTVTRGKMRVYRINPTLSTTAYSAGHALSGLFELTNVVPAAGRGTFLHSVQVNCVQAPSFLRLIFFDATPSGSTWNNQATVVLAYGDQEKVAGYVDIGGGVAIDSNSYTAGPAAASPALPKPMMPLSGTSLLVGFQAISGVTLTGAADVDVTLIFYDE